jgi:hypothetical protein
MTCIGALVIIGPSEERADFGSGGQATLANRRRRREGKVRLQSAAAMYLHSGGEETSVLRDVAV